MKYVLDTNAVSELMKGNPQVLNRLQRVSRKAVNVPQPVFAEIAYGIERLPKSKRKDALRQRFELLRAELARTEWSDAVTDSFGHIKSLLEKKGRRIEDFDAAIAAHAVGTGLTLVTANANDMARVPGLVFEDWSIPGEE